MSMPRAVRHINEVRALDVVFLERQVSRAGIARELGLTRSTAGSIVANLVEEGLLLEDASGDDKSAGTGRPGTYVRLNPHHALFLGADIGIGRISVVAVDFAGAIVAEHHVPQDGSVEDADTVLAALAATVKTVLDPLKDHRLHGLCVTLPGIIDHGGTVVRAPFLGWRNVPVVEKLTALLPEIPVITAENDANAFALADGYRAETRPQATEVHIFLDAGVGGAILVNGELLRGRDGRAGEFGHMVLGEQGFAKVATHAGSFESFIGRNALIARHHHHGGTAETIEAFHTLARKGEPAALFALSDWTRYLGRGLAAITSILNPARIVLGGPVAGLYALCAEEAKAAMRQNLLDDEPLPDIALSPLGLEGPALGGAYKLHRTLFTVNESLVFRTSLPTA